MKNKLSACLIAATALTHTAKADFAGFEIGAYQWKADYEGTVQSDTSNISGSVIDVQDELGLSDDSDNIFWASLELPVPFMPNFKLVASNIETTSHTVLAISPIIFNGQTYLLNENIVTTTDLSNIEYTFYYEILDNWVNLDLGLTIREYDGEVRLASQANIEINEFEEIDYTIPLIYVKGRFDLPLTGFFAEVEINAISYQEDAVTDLLIGVGYESEIGLGGKIGYKAVDLDVEKKDIKTDLAFEGACFSIFYHF